MAVYANMTVWQGRESKWSRPDLSQIKDQI